jgi:hypothetical protein
MPRYHYPSTPDRFDRLPKKLRALLLALLFLVGCAAFLLMGRHSIHTGDPIYSSLHTLTAGACFVWSALFLVVTGMLFGVSMGWINSNRQEPPQ